MKLIKLATKLLVLERWKEMSCTILNRAFSKFITLTCPRGVHITLCHVGSTSKMQVNIQNINTQPNSVRNMIQDRSI